MKIDILKLDDKQNKLTFSVADTTIPFMNALRRIMISEVPTMAIEDVEIRKNNGILYDEVLSHRLGLIPIKTDLSSYNLKEECTCKGAGCAKCTLKMTLQVKGPCEVYSKSIKSKDPKVKPINDDFLIAKLDENQEIEVENTAILGKGKEHMKWSPANASYILYTNVKINKQPVDPEAVKKACAFNVFDVKKDKLEIINDIHCTRCEACIDLLENDDITLKTDDTKFVFNVESWGQLQPIEIVENAISQLNSKIKEVEKLL